MTVNSVNVRSRKLAQKVDRGCEEATKTKKILIIPMDKSHWDSKMLSCCPRSYGSPYGLWREKRNIHVQWQVFYLRGERHHSTRRKFRFIVDFYFIRYTLLVSTSRETLPTFACSVHLLLCPLNPVENEKREKVLQFGNHVNQCLQITPTWFPVLRWQPFYHQKRSRP